MFAAAILAALAAALPCETVQHDGYPYTACRALPNQLSLHLTAQDGRPYADFRRLEAEHGEPLWAMNAGMYHEDRSPVGLFVAGGEKAAPLNREAGEGNFFLLPNGVFWVDEAGAHVATTDDYAAAPRAPRLATQSGPMLLIGGEPHPAFNPDSTSVFVRNGIAVQDGVVVAVVAEAPVSLHRFAAFFRDRLGVTDALYLDGTITRLRAPGLDRYDHGARMGPILAAWPAAAQTPR